MRRWLLASITALGVLSAVAFSASYQMVARFANKNVVALGLGCAGCGLIVLGLELALGALPLRERARNVWLLELTAGARRAACSALQYHMPAATTGVFVFGNGSCLSKLERQASAACSSVQHCVPLTWARRQDASQTLVLALAQGSA